MIDILIPVLGRPQNAQPLVDSIRATTQTDHQVWFVCSENDDAEILAASRTGCAILIREQPPGPGDYAKKINQAFAETGADWLFMGADDLTFEPNWDIQALRVAADDFHVVGTNDLANGQVQRGLFGTHCLIRRRYITDTGGTVDQGPGVVLCEGYDHNFVDRELCHVAQHRRRFVPAPHSRVRHRHPLWRTAPNDPTYVKALAKFRQDQRLFLSRAHLWGYVGLSAQERKMAA